MNSHVTIVFAAIRSLIYMTCFLLLWGWLALGSRGYDKNFSLELPSWTTIFGILFIASGGFLAILCVSTFVFAGRGTPAPFDPPRRFVVMGPYKWVRNPMYIGGFLMLFGLGLLYHSPSMLLFSMFALALVHAFVVFAEEKGLERRFGNSYIEYKQSVRRWLPKIPPQGSSSK